MSTQDKNTVTVPTWLVGFPLAIIVLFVSVINKGFAVSMTWALFMPLVFGLPALSVPLAIALTALSVLIFPSNTDFKQNDNKIKSGLLFFTIFITPWALYLIALVATRNVL